MFLTKRLAVLNLMPIMITLALSSLWFVDITVDRIIINYASYIQIILDWFAYPIYLIFLNGFYHKKYKKYLFLDKIIFMVANIFVINLLHYFTWFLSTTLLNITDAQSRLLYASGWQFPLHFILAGGFVVQMVLIIEYFIDKSE